MPISRSMLAVAIGVGVGIGLVVTVLWHDRERQSDARREAILPALPQAQSAPREAIVPAEAQTQPAPQESLPRRAPARAATAAPDVVPERVAPGVPRRGAHALLDELAAIRVAPGAGPAGARARILSLLNLLAQEGPSALPVLRQFLVSGSDVAYRSPESRGAPRDAGNPLPPSLRMGLFEVIADIGGPGAEQVLVDETGAARNAAELAVLVSLLEELSPGTHRLEALAATRRLLGSGTLASRGDRDAAYGILIRYGDASFVGTAQAQLVQPDGSVDDTALRYLKQMLGDRAVALVAQTYQDQRITDPRSKEALARVALAYVGASDQALELYHKATLDPALDQDQRRNLVEDLNEDGLTSTSKPSQEDLRIIAERYALAQAYLQEDYVKRDGVLDAAFREAAKDLANMLRRAGISVPPIPPRS